LDNSKHKGVKDLISLILKSWKEFIELIGLIFSVIVVYQTGYNWLSSIISIIIIIAIGVAIYSIFLSYYELKANAYHSASAINEYMYNWLAYNNRAIIFSRDMSWANNDERIVDVLKKKAEDSELTLILAERTPLVTELEKRGAHFIGYDFLEYTPRTRFTVVNYGSMDEKVAIGKEDEHGVHRINEYKSSDGIAYFLVKDLISLLTRLENNRGQNERN